MGAHDFKLNKVPLLLALVTANRYNCGVKHIYVNALVKFH